MKTYKLELTLLLIHYKYASLFTWRLFGIHRLCGAYVKLSRAEKIDWKQWWDKKIAIDTFALDNEIHLFDTKLLASDLIFLAKFDCRKKILQRSK